MSSMRTGETNLHMISQYQSGLMLVIIVSDQGEEEDLHHLTGVTAQGGSLVLREDLVILILFLTPEIITHHSCRR